MITLLALSLICLVALVIFSVVGGVVLTLIGLPLALLFGILPWLLRIVGLVLLFKALFDKPIRWENFMPAVVALALSWLLGWF